VSHYEARSNCFAAQGSVPSPSSLCTSWSICRVATACAIVRLQHWMRRSTKMVGRERANHLPPLRCRLLRRHPGDLLITRTSAALRRTVSSALDFLPLMPISVLFAPVYGKSLASATVSSSREALWGDPPRGQSAREKVGHVPRSSARADCFRIGSDLTVLLGRPWLQIGRRISRLTADCDRL
jgi:hypothetical protein